MKNNKYLVRPGDYHIFELDESNGCYRSWSTRNVTRGDVTRVHAQKHFTYDNLVNYYDFIPITGNELKQYEAKHDEYHKFISWSTRSDGHGGSKGGTREEYDNLKK